MRGVFATPLAWLATVLYVAWQVVAEQKLFLHTFLVERMGNRRVPKLPLGYRNVLALKSIMLWQQITGDPGALKRTRERVYERVLRRLRARGVTRSVTHPVPEYMAGEISPRTFYKEHVKKGVPCVIRGFGGPDVQRWKLASLAERFPETVAQVLDKSTKKIIPVSLRTVHEDRREKYVPMQALLDQNPGLRDFFDVPRSNEFFPVMGRSTRPVVSFLIIGLGSGLNANYHCEESPNWYLAVSGSKHWTLVEAEYSWLLYPAARGTGMRRFSEFLPNERGEPRNVADYPLVEYAPRYGVEVHAGDVLYFPAWMWHKTINLDEEGLGVTCRYTAPTPMSNRYFRCLQLLSPSFWKSSVQVVRGLIRGDLTGLEEVGDYNEQEAVLY